MLKNGEIQVLRDSLRGAQQEKETQRQKHIQQESQRQKEQSDREKELSRKVTTTSPNAEAHMDAPHSNADSLSLFRFIRCSLNYSLKKQRSMK